jgi:erythromycin esterase
MTSYSDEIKKRVRPLGSIDDLYPLIDKIKDKKVVMLGESSHGTSEYYQWRKEISLELIRNHGFSLKLKP